MLKIIRKILNIVLKTCLLIFFLVVILTLIINVYMINYSKEYLIKEENTFNNNYDSIVVLGASVKSDGTPSVMLQDRLDEAIVLYNIGISPRILMSGDHLNDDYDEVTVMKNYAVNKGISSDNIYVDHLGLNTFDSMYRLKKIYNLNKVLIVTQDYHQYRAIYLARKFGIEAYGVNSNARNYSGQLKRDLREILARVKDFFKFFFHSDDINSSSNSISIYESGNLTNKK